MATTLTYAVADFIPFTKILSADVNSRFRDIKNRFNWDGTTGTGLGDDNVQSNTVSGGGLTRATKLKKGTASYVIVNDGTGAMSETATVSTSQGGLGFTPTINSTTAGQVVGVNDAGTALTLRTAEASTLIEGLHNVIAGITAGEVISVNDAVALTLNQGTYRVVRAESDISARNTGFLGFALNAATVTPQISTATKSSTWTAGSESITVNGRTYTQAFATSNDNSMTQLALLVNADQDVQSAAVTGGSPNNVITITGKGALSLTITSSASGGAPTLTIAQTQAQTGSNVRIQVFGPLTGFTSLTQGGQYYVSTTAGAITTAPINGASFTGQALSSTVLFVSPNRFAFQFAGNFGIMIRSHGSSSGGTSTGNATQDSEHFNFTTWSTGTADTTVRFSVGGSEAGYQGNHYVVDGMNSAATAANLYAATYNKTTWATFTQRATAKQAYSVGTLTGILYFAMGSTSNDASSGVATLESWNGSSWTSVTSFPAARIGSQAFTHGGFLRVIGGTDTGSTEKNDHNTYNGVTVGTDTVFPQSKHPGGVIQATGSYGFVGWYTGSANKWNGSWSSTISFGTQVIDGNNGRNTGPVGSYDANGSKGYVNGGGSGGNNSISSTFSFDGSSLSASTASSNARAGASGSTI